MLSCCLRLPSCASRDVRSAGIAAVTERPNRPHRLQTLRPPHPGDTVDADVTTRLFWQKTAHPHTRSGAAPKQLERRRCYLGRGLR